MFSATDVSLASQFQNNQFSGPMVRMCVFVIIPPCVLLLTVFLSQLLAAMAQLLLITFERLAYLYRSSAAKFALQAVTVCFIHAVIFFVVPLTFSTSVKPALLTVTVCYTRTCCLCPDRPFSTNVICIVFYLTFCVYFLLGARQLYHGYSKLSPSNSLLSNGTEFPMPLIIRWVCEQSVGVVYYSGVHSGFLLGFPSCQR